MRIERHWRPYPIDETCKLYLPFYKYGSEAKIWDISTSHNDGVITGAVPGYPHERIANGSFATAGAGGVDVFASWTESVDLATDVVRDTSDYISSPASCRIDATNTGIDQYSLSIFPNRKYRISFWYKNSLDKVAQWRLENTGSNIYLNASGSWVTPTTYINLDSALTWTQVSIDFYGHPSYSSYDILFRNSGGASVWFDNVSVTLLDPLGPGWFTDPTDDKVVIPSLNLGTTHSLRIWLRYLGAGAILGGAADYAFRFVGANLGYNAGTVEQTQAHGLTVGDMVCLGLIRNGTALQFYKNGVALGTEKTLGANNDFTIDTIADYTATAAPLSAVWGEIIANNTNIIAQEIRNHYELTRSIYGV